MHGWTWRATLFGAMVTVLIYTATRPDPETAGLSSASSSQLVDLLSSSRDVVRRSAAARLLAQGANAIPALVNAIPEANEHELNQIFLVLEDLYVSSDENVADVAEDAIEQLAASGTREIRHGAEQVFQSNMSRRHLRACSRIESFGGQFVASPMSYRGGDPLNPFVIAIIKDDWTGGDEGLKYLRRILPTLIAVHISTEAPVSEDALEMLTSFVAVRRENEACLGVELQERTDEGLTIRRLVPYSPASVANLQRFDRIVRLAGEPIANYYDFIMQLRKLHYGDQVELVVLRDNAPVPVTVTMGSDFGTGHCRCEGSAVESVEPEELTASEDDGRHGSRYLPSTDRVSPIPQEPPRPRHGAMHDFPRRAQLP